jgi:glutamine---fructose-6-phosphate transaminase (isomerizing)
LKRHQFKVSSIIMCGIVGYAGNREAQPILLDCLSHLEYRGYDSCGVAIYGNCLKGYKDAGRVQELQRRSPLLPGTIGIGHTRWATHGIPNAINAHPHYDCSGKIAVVHNGIISNYQILRQILAGEGHSFVSDTDTEVIPHLIEKYYRGDLVNAVGAALKEIEGTYAILASREGHDFLVISRRDSPLVIGLGNNEKFVASDVPAILAYTNKIIYLEDGDIARVSKDSVDIFRNQATVNRTVHQILWDKKEVEKGGYDHFMLKEIHEQPRVIRNSLKEFQLTNSGGALPPVLDVKWRDLLLLACGTSYHAALIGKYIIQEYLGIPVRAEVGSEFNHCSRIIIPSAAIALTQSGETADILVPLKKLKQTQTRTFVITNVPGSTASRLADMAIYTDAGPEVSVAATKSFTAQLMEIYKMVLSCHQIDLKVSETLVTELRRLPALVQEVLDNQKQIENAAFLLSRYNTAFYIGRGINFPIALEGALKLKEISYIHAEGYAAGELKHGPFALLDRETPVIALVAQDETYSSMTSSIKEIKARQSPVISLADEGDESIASLVDMVIKVPHVSKIFSPVVFTVVLQLIAYFTARYKGCPIDYPRNLAKSVTVE